MLQIFDVDHGSAALYTDAAGGRTLFDCGHSSVTGFRPSQLLGGSLLRTHVARLYVSHADEDHVSDLARITSAATIGGFYRNRSIPTHTLRAMKLLQGPLREGVATYLELDETFTTPFGLLLTEPATAELSVEAFSNAYPTFTDTNNLSLVAFASFGDVRVVFPGDLERAGWLALLGDAIFRHRLSRVNVFVASHHGRESGYCHEVFDVCKPEIIVVSDMSVQFGSQETNYAKHASGVTWDDGSIRRVLSTRRDGHITVAPNSVGGWRIQTSA